MQKKKTQDKKTLKKMAVMKAPVMTKKVTDVDLLLLRLGKLVRALPHLQHALSTHSRVLDQVCPSHGSVKSILPPRQDLLKTKSP